MRMHWGSDASHWRTYGGRIATLMGCPQTSLETYTKIAWAVWYRRKPGWHTAFLFLFAMGFVMLTGKHNPYASNIVHNNHPFLSWDLQYHILHLPHFISRSSNSCSSLKRSLDRIGAPLRPKLNLIVITKFFLVHHTWLSAWSCSCPAVLLAAASLIWNHYSYTIRINRRHTCLPSP